MFCTQHHGAKHTSHISHHDCLGQFEKRDADGYRSLLLAHDTGPEALDDEEGLDERGELEGSGEEPVVVAEHGGAVLVRLQEDSVAIPPPIGLRQRQTRRHRRRRESQAD